jgi:hypothetical protein
MENYDVSLIKVYVLSTSADLIRYSEILDYHNVDAAAQEGENGS